MIFKNIWWLLLLKGILFIIFGFVAIGWPTITLAILTFIFALLILSSGILNLVSGITSIDHGHKHWFLTIIIGIIEIGVGAYAFSNPAISLIILTLLIGFTLIVRGIFEIASAFESAHSGSQRALLAIGGILGILAGIIILRYPIAGGLAYVWVLGLYGIVMGAIYIALSMIAKGAIDDLIEEQK